MPSNTPSVAVVIPAWEAGPWLQKAVESALAQTHPVNSIVVVDNASTDGSVDSLNIRDPRLTILRLDSNRGACAARNVGWRHAAEQTSAEWLQFLDADDALNPTKIATQLSQAGDLTQRDVIYSPVIHQLWQPDSDTPDPVSLQVIDPTRPLVAQWLRWELGQTGALLWRHTALEAIGGWREDQPCCQDNEITLRAMKAGLRFGFTPTADAVYRQWSATSLSRADPARTLRQRAALTLDCLNWVSSTDPSTLPALRPVIAEEAYAVARLLAAHGHIQEAARYLRDIRHLTPISPTGRACPFSYRLLHRLLGFPLSENLANHLRHD